MWWIAAGVLALGAYGFVAAFQPDQHFGRLLGADGAVFVAGSLAWGVVVDKFRPDRWDIIGASILNCSETRFRLQPARIR